MQSHTTLITDLISDVERDLDFLPGEPVFNALVVKLDTLSTDHFIKFTDWTHNLSRLGYLLAKGNGEYMVRLYNYQGKSGTTTLLISTDELYDMYIETNGDQYRGFTNA